MDNAITNGQLQKLQVLYSQLCAHTDQANTREARIGWAQGLLMRPISSFKDLSVLDAKHLIDTLNGQLGIAPTRKAGRPSRRKRLNRDAARRAGLDGRHDGQEFAAAPQLASAQDLAVIDHFISRLGWDRAGLDRFLHSNVSPLKTKSREIRTHDEANKVRWALKGMLVRAGKWEKRTA